jgi:hypothetical protein
VALARHIVHAGTGVLSRHGETNYPAVVAPAMRQADDPGDDGGADLNWNGDGAGTGLETHARSCGEAASTRVIGMHLQREAFVSAHRTFNVVHPRVVAEYLTSPYENEVARRVAVGLGKKCLARLRHEGRGATSMRRSMAARRAASRRGCSGPRSRPCGACLSALGLKR